MTERRRVLRPKDIEEQLHQETSTRERPLRARLGSKISVGKEAGTRRTSAEPKDLVAPAAPRSSDMLVDRQPVAPGQEVETAAPQTTAPMPRATRSADNKAAMAEIRRLESAGDTKEAASMAEQRGWADIARKIVQRARPRRKEPLRAAPPAAPSRAQSPTSSVQAPPGPAPTEPVMPPAPAPSQPTAAPTPARAAAAPHVPEDVDASVPGRRMPRRKINMPDEVRDRYSLPRPARRDD